MRTTRWAALVGCLGLLLGAGPASSAGALGSTAAVHAAPVAVATATPAPTGMARLVDVSKNGRIALGQLTEGGPTILRDLVRGKTLRTLKSGASYSYKSLSSNGRYVHFTKQFTTGGCTYARPWVLDRKTGKAKLAAATRTGKALKAKWGSPGNCPYLSVGEEAFSQHSIGGPGQMSPDGRWVAFCANLTQPDRGDLYVKDLRTRKLTIMPDVCQVTSEAHELYSVHVSEGARAIMVIGNEQGSTLSWIADLVLKRRVLQPVVLPGGATASQLWLTDDGTAIYFETGAGVGGRYDVATVANAGLPVDDPLGITAAIPPFEEYREQVGMTRRGRYVSYNGSRIDPTVGRVGLIGVFDRATGLSTNLTAAMQAAGVPLQVGSPPVPNSLLPVQISADGNVLLFPAPGGWVAVRWMT